MKALILPTTHQPSFCRVLELIAHKHYIGDLELLQSKHLSIIRHGMFITRLTVILHKDRSNFVLQEP